MITHQALLIRPEWLYHEGAEISRDAQEIAFLVEQLAPGGQLAKMTRMRKLERLLTIPTPDQKLIYGVLHTPPRQSAGLAIFVHGVTGHSNQFLMLTVARMLTQRGIPVMRFNQYDDRSNARRFHETTIRMHVADTKQVVEYARGLGFSRIVLVGHSLGGPIAITAADDSLTGLLLWDPTFTPTERVKDWERRDPRGNIPYLEMNTRHMLGEEWLADAKTFPDAFAQISALNIPVKIIGAEQGGKLEACQRYHASLRKPSPYTVISRADHAFTEEGTVEELAEESFQWLEQLLKSPA